MKTRQIDIERKTNESDIVLSLNLDGTGRAEVSTGIAFLDHLLTSLARHARFDLTLSCRGDLEVDDHHTAEDCGLVLGSALDRLLDQRRGITRFGWALVPLDESLARVVVDLSGRPYASVDLGLTRDKLGGLACENIGHLLTSFAMASRTTLHVDILKGANDHHRAECPYKALALALRQAVAGDDSNQVPSTKGVL